MPNLANTAFAWQPERRLRQPATLPSSQAWGNDAMKILEATKEISRHWGERAEILVVPQNTEDAFSYNRMPPSSVTHVRVRYIYKGKGQPKPFDFDSE